MAAFRYGRFSFEEGEYARRVVSCEESAGSVTVRIGERSGSFVPEREALQLELCCFGSAPESVAVNGESVEARHDEESGTVLVPLEETGDALTVEIVR